MRQLFFFLLLLYPCFVFSQAKLDSLLQALPRIRNDSLKIETLITIGTNYLRVNQEKALDYFTQAEEVANNSKSKRGLAKAKYRKGTAWLRMNKLEEALFALKAAEKGFEELDNSKGLATVKTDIASLYRKQNRIEEAVALYISAIDLNKHVGDKNGEARAYNSLGSIYQLQKQYKKAIESYERALFLVEELDFKPGISACLNNLGIVYTKIKNYEKAIVFLERALVLKNETADVLGSSRVLGNLGNIYLNQKQYNKAEKHYNEALNSAYKVENLDEIVKNEFGLAKTDFHRGEYKKSIAQIENLIPALSRINDLKTSLQVYNLLSQVYEKENNFKQSLKYARLYRIYSDSLYDKNLATISNDIESKYQNQQKEKEITFLASEKELQSLKLQRRNNQRTYLIIFAVIMLFTVTLLYNQYRIKQKSNKKLQELDTLKSNFFANISHEFRTPLTLIKGPVEHLEQNFDEKLSLENVKMIRRNTNRVLTLVNQLLDLSKIDSGNLKLRLTEGDIFKCLRAATTSFSSHAAQRNIDFRIQVPSEVFWTSFDRDKLEKVVYNLLSNAFKFSEDSSVISCTVSYEKGNLRIQVSDSGSGIPEDSLPFIFDRFYQVDSSFTKEKQGSGIGLSLSKDLVELMDGTITVSSEISKGTFFTVQLPIQEIKTRNKKSIVVQQYNTESSEEKESSQIPVPDKRNLPVVLLVDDNKDMRHFITDLLINKYRVTQAINGKEGLSNAVDNLPDLIITDLMMPKMDGIEFCSKLKTDVNTSHIPIIMLTAKAGIENKIEGLQTGADDYLTKPFEAKELLARAKNLITQRKNLRELYSNKHVQVDPKKITITSIDQKFLEKAISLLEDNYKDPDFNIQQMQEALAMSKSQLHRKLKALTNEAPGELLRNYRLKRAAQLLAQKADNVTQIAYQVGFNNLSYFAKCFKEFYGVSPSTFNKH